jgi:hypothetical protein
MREFIALLRCESQRRPSGHPRGARSNLKCNTAELTQLIKDSGARAIVVMEMFAATVAHALTHIAIEHVGDLCRGVGSTVIAKRLGVRIGNAR